jgi:hypothetical protein
MDNSEKHYIDGRNDALRRLIVHCANELGVFSKEDVLVKLAYLIDERERTRKALREVCADWDCNEWSDDLDLADVVNGLTQSLKEIASN